MAARDRYDIGITCKKCGQTASIGISEDDHPYMKKLHRSVDWVEGDFDASMKSDVVVSITCKKCGTENLWPKDSQC